MDALEHLRLIKTDISANSNKFWNAWLMPDGTVKVEHGRVGASSRRLEHPGAGKAYFNQKVAEKLGKGYKKAQVLEQSEAAPTHAVPKTDLKEVAKRDIGGGKLVNELIDLLVEENIHLIEGATTITYNRATGLFSTPLGIVSPAAIVTARRLLNELDTLRAGRLLRSPKAQGVAEQFLMLIPQKVGRKVDVEELFGRGAAISKQNDVLDALESATRTAIQPVASFPPTTNGEPDKLFRVSLEVAGLEEFRRIRQLFHDSKQKLHNCTLGIHTVYRLQIETMDQAFEACGRKLGNVQQLWHGTKNANVLSILKSGFQITPARTVSRTGSLFGSGLYFANQSSKALGYVDGGRWNRLGKKPTSFLFLAEVALGKCHVPPGGCSSRTAPPRGYDSIHAVPGKTAGVLNPEFVIFQANQCRPQYLISCVDGGK